MSTVSYASLQQKKTKPTKETKMEKEDSGKGKGKGKGKGTGKAKKWPKQDKTPASIKPPQTNIFRCTFNSPLMSIREEWNCSQIAANLCVPYPNTELSLRVSVPFLFNFLLCSHPKHLFTQQMMYNICFFQPLSCLYTFVLACISTAWTIVHFSSHQGVTELWML